MHIGKVEMRAVLATDGVAGLPMASCGSEPGCPPEGTPTSDAPTALAGPDARGCAVAGSGAPAAGAAVAEAGAGAG